MRTTTAALGGVVLSALLATGVADAATGAVATARTAAGTATWSATLVRSDGAVLTGRPYTADYTALLPFAVYLSARNTGTTALTGQVYSISGYGFALSGVALDACTTGPWQNGSCPGQVVPVRSGATAALPVAPGASVGLRLSLPAGVGVSVSVSASTSRAHVRAATTTNS
ncbi:hypothetical protein [Saccharothrix syringae]|uniref:hypothetical protein n=1 Tax=Saccharothrix syringae TaxID=103733 RepID=UPI000524AB3B|nr:hypothetical protein [Saccharothrix syringae]